MRTVKEQTFDLLRKLGVTTVVGNPGSTEETFLKDFPADFDYVLALDHDNLAELMHLAPDAQARAKIHLLRAFDPASPPDSDVPDPYYGNIDGFESVFDICEAACRGLLDHLRRTHRLS